MSAPPEGGSGAQERGARESGAQEGGTRASGAPERTTALFEAACRGEPLPRPPIWIMRQAGRYLPEYRKIRESVDFLTLTRTPELAAEVTLQPVRRFGMDAAILFSDIMTPLEGMGVPIRFSGGPVIDQPIRSARDLERMRPLDPEDGVPFVLEAVRHVRTELPPELSLIGFSGAPFTLLCYLVEGKGSKSFVTARAFVRSERQTALQLLDLLGDSMARYLIAQAEAGADALMLFDSWAGLLGPEAYEEIVLPSLCRCLAGLRAATDRPLLYFPRGGGAFLDRVRELDVDVVGIDWTIPLSRAAKELGTGFTLQGNLDPAALFAPDPALAREIDQVLEEGRSARAHIFNLGHGIDAATDLDKVSFLVDRVRERGADS